MDEEEYTQYIEAIDEVERRLMAEDRELQEQCRDESGCVVPGCTYTLPAQTYG